MLRLFYYREITGWSYRNLAAYPESAETFGLERIPDESVLSRAWRERFDAAVREFITTGAHYVVKEVHDLDLSVPLARRRLTDFLLKAGVDGKMNYAPVLTAGECVEIVVSALIPPD
jgi:hypothetical protein